MVGETKRTDDAGALREGAPDDLTAVPAQTPLPPTAAAFAGKAKELEALRDAVVDAANVGAGLWFSYLFVLLYFVIAVGSVTHRNLFFENPAKLPFLNVDLPLIGFFILGPALFLIVHAYVLLHFVLLAGKVGVFHTELQAQIADENVRARLRRQLPSNIFVQFLAGPLEVRTGVMGAMLRLVAQISLVAGPLALLVFFQFQFLPYHNEPVAWWQRLAVVADLALLWTLWPSVARGETTSIGWRDFRRRKVIVAAAASVVPVLLVFTIATFPGEWLHKNPVSVPLIPEFKDRGWHWITPHDFLVAGDVDLVARKPTSLWSNRLVLPGLDVPPESFSLRGRHLEGAVLLSANLRKMDFTAAQLQGAVLDDADLRDAKFLCAASKLKVDADSAPGSGDANTERHCTQLQHASLMGAQLQGAMLNFAELQHASLDNAQLQGASLDNARLQEAKLHGAKLQGASLKDAQLQGASLDRAWLQGAMLDHASLHGASLDSAQLQGTSLDTAQLQAASLDTAQLHGASLKGASLDGARLDNAELYGASFEGASLQGASLDYAWLQGASLDRTDLQATSLQDIFVWRADARNTRGENALVGAAEMGPTYLWTTCLQPRCDWTPALFAALKRLIEEQVPDGEYRRQALQRVSILDPATPLADQEEMAKTWTDLARSPPSSETYAKSLADVWRQTGCQGSDNPYIIRGLLRSFNVRFRAGTSVSKELAAAFLDEAHCANTRALSEEDKVKLREIRDYPAPTGGRRGPRHPRHKGVGLPGR